MPVVLKLRILGYDVLTIQETGNAGQSLSDEAVLSFAVSEKRAVLTLNRKHFIKLHKMKPQHAGIIICSFDIDFIGQAHRIHAAVELNMPLSDKLIRVNRLPEDKKT